MNRSLLHYLLLACFLPIAPPVSAEFVASPSPTFANRIGLHPFLLTSSDTPSIRMQEVHAARDFLAAPGPVLIINSISYSTPAWSGRVPIDVTLPNVEIRMSTSPKSSDGLSANFAENIGSDQMVVYSGALHFYETGLETYDIHIPIAPFRYDPSAGNLLIDIFNYAPIAFRRDPDWNIDVADSSFDSVSTISGRVSDTSGGSSTIGATIQLTYTPVPEPSTWALLALGLAGLGIGQWKPQRTRR